MENQIIQFIEGKVKDVIYDMFGKTFIIVELNDKYKDMTYLREERDYYKPIIYVYCEHIKLESKEIEIEVFSNSNLIPKIGESIFAKIDYNKENRSFSLVI